LFKALQTDTLTMEDFQRALKLVGGTQVHVKRQDILSGQESNEKSKNKGFSITEI
jgi:hypothetical protein